MVLMKLQAFWTFLNVVDALLSAQAQLTRSLPISLS